MLRPVTAPTAEPLTLAEVRKHLRQQVDDPNALLNFEAPDDDSYVTGLITAAREAAEDFLGWPLTDAEYVQTQDAFETEVELPAWSGAVSKVEYLDANNATQTVLGTDYWFDAYVPTVYFTTLPTSTSTRASAVRIFFRGQTSLPCPQSVKHAMLLLIGHWYQNREATSDGRAVELPFGVEALLRPLRTELSMA